MHIDSEAQDSPMTKSYLIIAPTMGSPAQAPAMAKDNTLRTFTLLGKYKTTPKVFPKSFA